MHHGTRQEGYFPYSIQISRPGWLLMGTSTGNTPMSRREQEPFIVFARRMAAALAQQQQGEPAGASGGGINLYALLNRVYRHLIARYEQERGGQPLVAGSAAAGFPVASPEFAAIATAFARYYPSAASIEEVAEEPPAVPDVPNHATCLTELLIIRLNNENLALTPYRPLCDDAPLAAVVPSRRLAAGVEAYLAESPPMTGLGRSLPEILRAPMKASPRSLAGQLEYIRKQWRTLLPPDLEVALQTAMDIIGEEDRPFFGGPGQPQVLQFTDRGQSGSSGYEYPEYERFSADAGWMANVVMIAKMTYVWLDQLSRLHGRPVHRLDEVPDEELDRLAGWGFTCLWLIGVWERSPASQQIKHIGGNREAIASAYSLYDYVIARDLGGEEALADLSSRCRLRGIRLASDMVPNHTGIYSRWTVEHPDWFIQLEYPPYPAYSFTGPDLSSTADITIQIEDGYWDRRDAAVVFRHHDHRNGRSRYIYHGNDGTSTPWNDTAQLNYLLPQVREAVIRTIIHVARQFPVIRFDAAMTLAKKHYQRLWYPQPGHGSGVPSRAEHGMSRDEFDHAFPEEFWREVVDRVAAEVPDTLLLAEAFWLMEGYFVRTLGMHRVYNSAFMNMLKLEENAKYRQTIKNVLEFDPEILKRFVNFMNNPDERTAVEQFGKEGKYLGSCVLLVTMPGLPMIGHGQIEGFHEKYGMEFRRASWDEPVDEHLVRLHEQQIFPLMRRRHIFSGSQDFVFYDFHGEGQVNEDVFAYSNRADSFRGLIIYHNRFAATAGWIRVSTARAHKNGEGVAVPVRTTLGEALSFDPGPGVYYAFRNYADGRHYLREGRELCERGLFLELGAYQYYAFLDFQELRDDGTGEWRELCRLLQGRPVTDLDEELKQVRFSGLINRYTSVHGLVEKIIASPDGEPSHEEIFAPLRRELEELLDAFNATVPFDDSERGAAVIAQGVEALAEFMTRPGAQVTQQNTPDMAGVTIAGTWERSLMAASLVLQGIALITLLRSPSWLNDYGLDRATADLATALPDTGPEPPVDPAATALLLQLIITHGDIFSARETDTDEDVARLLFDDPRVRAFLLVHESGDTEWFVRERWELLLRWLSLSALFVEALLTGECSRMDAVAIATSRRRDVLIDAAVREGYRVAGFRTSGTAATKSAGQVSPQ